MQIITVFLMCDVVYLQFTAKTENIRFFWNQNLEFDESIF